jgi:hypothetical protein
VEGLWPGATCTVWTSTDLSQWEPVANFTAGIDTSATIDIVATGDERFYRVGP